MGEITPKKALQKSTSTHLFFDEEGDRIHVLRTPVSLHRPSRKELASVIDSLHCPSCEGAVHMDGASTSRSGKGARRIRCRNSKCRKTVSGQALEALISQQVPKDDQVASEKEGDPEEKAAEGYVSDGEGENECATQKSVDGSDCEQEGANVVESASEEKLNQVYNDGSDEKVEEVDTISMCQFIEQAVRKAVTEAVAPLHKRIEELEKTIVAMSKVNAQDPTPAEAANTPPVRKKLSFVDALVHTRKTKPTQAPNGNKPPATETPPQGATRLQNIGAIRERGFTAPRRNFALPRRELDAVYFQGLRRVPLGELKRAIRLDTGMDEACIALSYIGLSTVEILTPKSEEVIDKLVPYMEQAGATHLPEFDPAKTSQDRARCLARCERERDCSMGSVKQWYSERVATLRKAEQAELSEAEAAAERMCDSIESSEAAAGTPSRGPSGPVPEEDDEMDAEMTSYE